MRIVITGAGGYIAADLVKALLEGQFDKVPVTRLVLNDLDLSRFNLTDPRVELVQGSLADAHVLDQLLAQPADWVFHLAGITSRKAEQDLALGLRVNLHATMALLEALRQQNRPARLVFASSIGVFGVPLPPEVNDSTPIKPTLSYGTQKHMAELLIADYTRRGHVDGRSIRLPGVIARPSQSIKALSTFSSDLLQELAAGRSYTCPVSAQATNWLISLPCSVAQIVHAAQTSTSGWPAERVVTLPALRVRTGDLVQALERHLGMPLSHLVQWAPNPQIEAQFGNWPLLHTQAADQLGFSHDGTAENLVARALQATPRS